MAAFSIFRHKGFILNPEDKIVNGILKGINRCKGKCPCYHPQEGEEIISDEDLMCPCKEYRENKHCRCNLYVEQGPTPDPALVIQLGEKYKQVCKELEEAKKEIEVLNTPKRPSNLVY